MFTQTNLTFLIGLKNREVYQNREVYPTKRVRLHKQYDKRKAYEDKVRKAQSLEIKKVPLFFNKEIKEENAKAEAYNKRLEQEKQKIAQNPVKDPSLQHKQVLDKYIESAAKCKITIDNTATRQERERNRLEQMKLTKEENQEQKRSTGYKR